MIEELAKLVPDLKQPGRVFYSGRMAFSGRATSLYVLGLNPGGDPRYERETIAQHNQRVLDDSAPDDWSAYRDECWGEGDGEPGKATMQKRVLHLLEQVGYPERRVGRVPASNLVFVRSSEEADIRGNFEELARRCWRFHDRVIKALNPRVILCFGKTCGGFVRRKLNANTLRKDFREKNGRRWKSQWFESDSGRAVVVVTHPSRANWVNPRTDPSGLVREALGK